MMLLLLGIVALLGIVGAFVIPPLVRGVDGTGGSTKLAWWIGAGVPAMALGIYWAIGTPEAVSPPPQETARQFTPEQVDGMVKALAKRMQSNPDDPQGWLMLGRSYRVLNRLPEAADAYANVVRLMPDDPDVLSDYADVLAAANGGSMKGDPQKAVAKALKIDPDNIKALALSGSAAFEGGDYVQATAFWKKAYAKLPPEAEIARALMASIEEAETLAKRPR